MPNGYDNSLVGKTVNVYFEELRGLFEYKIVYAPNTFGDCFILEGPEESRVLVKNFVYMEVLDS